MSELLRTPLFPLHRELGARLVPFAGYEMPLQYPRGIIAEHHHCREAAALFDVSHMGQIAIRGPDAAQSLERLVPSDLRALAVGRSRYTVFTNAQGGILDDLIVGRDAEDELFLVVNAACKRRDFEHLRQELQGPLEVSMLEDRALLALQGPKAEEVLARIEPRVCELRFMGAGWYDLRGFRCRISRTGYTGEDGFEISIPAEAASDFARLLLDLPEVAPAGLGARDTLRLEAGLCLYGQDIDETTTPVEAGLSWVISRRRRSEAGFPGAETILRQLREGPPRMLVGLRPEGRQPVRAGCDITTPDGLCVGRITSGSFGPTVGGPVAMGYLRSDQAIQGGELRARVRGRSLALTVVELPFVPHRYRR